MFNMRFPRLETMMGIRRGGALRWRKSRPCSPRIVWGARRSHVTLALVPAVHAPPRA
jgi:hypothetical protein